MQHTSRLPIDAAQAVTQKNLPKSAWLTFIAIILSVSLAPGAYADYYDKAGYEVTITNLTKASQFTPILAATHKRYTQFFELGAAPSPGLANMAEGGDVSELLAEANATGGVIDTANSADVLGPPPLLFAGQSVKLKINGKRYGGRFSMAAMILPSNDSFVALNSVSLPRRGTRVYYAVGYDAGSEPNDESCLNIPGPLCNGAGGSPDAGGEGFVHVANGIQGIGDVNNATYDWRNPVACIEIKRVY